MRLLNKMLNLSRIFDCFNLPHYVTSNMHHAGKKESKKEIFKKKKQIRLRKICVKGIRIRTLGISYN